MTNYARPGISGNETGATPPPVILSSVYPLDIRSDVSNPSLIGEGAGPLASSLPGADFQGGPASILESRGGVFDARKSADGQGGDGPGLSWWYGSQGPHRSPSGVPGMDDRPVTPRDPDHFIFFLPPDQEPPAESIPRDSRLGRLMAAILSLRAIPLPRSRDVQPEAFSSLASGCEFQCSHPNSFRRGFALGTGIMAALWLATITDGADASLTVLGVSGAVVLASALSDKFLSSRAAASPKLSNSSGTHTPASPTCRANAAFSSRPQIGAPVAKLCVALRSLVGIPSLHLQRPQNGSGAVGRHGTSSTAHGTVSHKTGAEADAVLG